MPNSFQKEEILQKIKTLGILKEGGHYVLSTGRHSSKFLKVKMLIQDIELISKICEAIAEGFRDDKIDAVLTKGFLPGPVLAYGVGQALSKIRNEASNRPVRIIIPMFTENKWEISPSNPINPQEKVLIVHDIAVRGGLINQLEDLVIANGAEIAGVGMIFDVSNDEVQFPPTIKKVVLFKEDFGKEDAVACSMCKEGLKKLEDLYRE